MYHCPKCHYGYVNPGGMNRGPPPQGYGVPQVSIQRGSCMRCGYTPENQCIFI